LEKFLESYPVLKGVLKSTSTENIMGEYNHILIKIKLMISQ